MQYEGLGKLYQQKKHEGAEFTLCIKCGNVATKYKNEDKDYHTVDCTVCGKRDYRNLRY